MASMERKVAVFYGYFMVQKIYSKMYPVPSINTPHDVTDLLNHGVVKNPKT